MALWRVCIDGVARLAVGAAMAGPQNLLAARQTISDLLAGPAGSFAGALAGPTDGSVRTDVEILPPIDGQEVWAAGVTYVKSRAARYEESQGADYYDKVYDAERPELFLKATVGRTRGPGQPITIRADSTWDVPEPELGVLADCHGEIVAYLIGNDVSSRSIEGENPLYLPQAKIYTGSCAVGPCLVPVDEAPSLDQMWITMDIRRRGESVYRDSVAVATMRRSPSELVAWLHLAYEFPTGVALLTGTGLVPGSEFTLQEDDEVLISISGLGELRNIVTSVGRPVVARGLAGSL